ncbi:unnamed protein product, partial [Urochloa humidicola]
VQNPGLIALRKPSKKVSIRSQDVRTNDTFLFCIRSQDVRTAWFYDPGDDASAGDNGKAP